MLLVILLIVAQIAVVAFLIFSSRKPKESGVESMPFAEDNFPKQDLQNTIEELKKELGTKNRRIEELEKELATSHKQNNELQEEVDKYKKSVYSLQAELDQLRKRNIQLEEAAEEKVRQESFSQQETEKVSQQEPKEDIYKLNGEEPESSIKPEEAENLKEFLEAKEKPSGEQPPQSDEQSSQEDNLS